MRQAFDIELVAPEETFTLVADSRDIRRWESTFDASYLDGTFSFTKFAQLAYVAATRQGRFSGTWEAFDARCVSAEGGDADGPQDAAQGDLGGNGSGDPTDPEPMDGS